ncbi:MAG: beta-L-arabinofuranosidase domain-containing protein [Kiritimatiellales bacterium]
MKKVLILSLLFLSTLVSAQTNASKFSAVRLVDIQPEGWLKTMLLNQENGLTGNLQTIGKPFMLGVWGGKPFVEPPPGANVKKGWAAHEQEAYLLDGMIRCGYLLKSDFLIQRATKSIDGALARVSSEGVIGSWLKGGGRRARWPHAVFFRALMAAYDNSGDQKILDAMEKHFVNDRAPLLEREMINVETMVWLYEKTGKPLYLDLVNNTLSPTDPKQAAKFEKEDTTRDFLVPDRHHGHGVTYLECLKIPALRYQATGDKKYLEQTVKGFEKLDKYHMLPDGVPSSEEGLSGQTAQNYHETCDISDYLWACHYMLEITGETGYADRMERALFNAGLGAITKDFDAHQYLSSPNQVYCNQNSSPVVKYPASRLAYNQLHNPPCCSGNVNRMIPIYAGSQWLKGENGTLVKALYGPGGVVHQVGASKITLREESVYPYSDSIVITVTEGAAEFPFQLRIPAWAENATVRLNGIDKPGVTSGTFFELKEKFKKGDQIEISLNARAHFKKWVGDAMFVEYGSMLFALPVKTLKEKVTLSSEGIPYMGYNMSPLSAWNYVLSADGTDQSLLKLVRTGEIDPVNPWAQQPQALSINVPAFTFGGWKETYQKFTVNGETTYAPMTPPLPAIGSMIHAKGEIETISLVPYGSTELRMSMFPFTSVQKIIRGELTTE